jgi:glycosyltransferase involved in cell wall biosynthesis
MKTNVIVPALNEAETIAAVVQATLEQPVATVIVVDNGSTDDTAILAQQAGAKVVGEARRGYGYACAAGVAAATDADILVFLDADFSSPPAEISQLIEPIEAGRAQMVLGSRMLGEIEPGAMLPHQHFGNWLTARLMRLLYGLQVTDLGPCRAIQADLLHSLNMQEMTFGWPTEMMVKAAKRKAQITEVPVSWHMRRAGQSKVSGTLKGSALATYYILGVTFRYAFSG